MYFRFLFMVLILLSGACMDQKIFYEFADGSSNLYLLTETELRYVAVVAEESSSGNYNGGKNQTKSISITQFNELKKLFDNAIENSSIHIPNRIMMSGMISNISSKRQCIIKPDCDEMIELEKALKKVLL